MLSRRDTVAAVLEAHNEQSVDKILVHHSENCTWEVLPKSLGRAPMDVSAYQKMYESIAPFGNTR